MFSGKPIPCVGISFGVDRIFSITKTRLGAESTIRPNEVDAFVMAFGGGKDFTGMLRERMQVAKELWDAGIKAEYLWKQKPKLQNQFKAAENGKVPWAVILGEDELKAGKVKIKEMGLPEDHPDKNGVEVEKANLVQELKRRLGGPAETELVDRSVGA
jgi:histidyl-tRNA synthetase